MSYHALIFKQCSSPRSYHTRSERLRGGHKRLATHSHSPHRLDRDEGAVVSEVQKQALIRSDHMPAGRPRVFTSLLSATSEQENSCFHLLAVAKWDDDEQIDRTVQRSMRGEAKSAPQLNGVCSAACLLHDNFSRSACTRLCLFSSRAFFATAVLSSLHFSVCTGVDRVEHRSFASTMSTWNRNSQLNQNLKSALAYGEDA